MRCNLSAPRARRSSYGCADATRMIGLAAAVAVAVALAACGGSSSKHAARAASTTSTATTTRPPPATSSVAQGHRTGSATRGSRSRSGRSSRPPSTTQTTPVDGIKCAPGRAARVPHPCAPGGVQQRPDLRAPGGNRDPRIVHAFKPARVRSRPAASASTGCTPHTSDGVIHIESPTQRIYTLGHFFDEWHQPLTANQVGDLHGKVTAFFNGKPWTKNVRAIPLLPHAVIQFDIGEPAAAADEGQLGRNAASRRRRARADLGTLGRRSPAVAAAAMRRPGAGAGDGPRAPRRSRSRGRR